MLISINKWYKSTVLISYQAQLKLEFPCLLRIIYVYKKKPIKEHYFWFSNVFWLPNFHMTSTKIIYGIFNGSVFMSAGFTSKMETLFLEIRSWQYYHFIVAKVILSKPHFPVWYNISIQILKKLSVMCNCILSCDILKICFIIVII